MNLFKRLFIIALAAVSFTSCELNDLLNTPTKQQMQGNWVLTRATDEQNIDITKSLNYPFVNAIQLNDKAEMIGSMGPMFTYLVYGGSKWSSIRDQIGKAFDYAHLRLDGGDFYVGSGQVDHFTVEPRLLASTKLGGGALIDVLKIFGVSSSFLEEIIYHKFVNVSISFEGKDTMIWTFDNATKAYYNLRDEEGNSFLWKGWPTDSFQRCTFEFTRKTLKLEDIITASRVY